MAAVEDHASLIADVDRAIVQLLSVQQSIPGTEVNLPEDRLIKIGVCDTSLYICMYVSMSIAAD